MTGLFGDRSSGSLRAIVAILGVLGPFVVPGCLFNPCGPSQYTDQEWIQQGLFEAFPPPGDYDGYAVSWTGRPELAIEKRQAEKNPSGASTFLTVYENNQTMWSASRSESLSNTATAQELNATFRALDLPAPTLTTWTFHWTDAGTGC